LWNEFEQPFKNDDVQNTQIKIGILVGGLPIWMEGVLMIRVYLKGDETELGSYRFDIVYHRQEAKAATRVADDLKTL
jgi:hypothetical protein